MPLAVLQVDAFTDRPFAGNPAAVCLLDQPADAGWMQAVAAEMNLSETAFLVRTCPDGWDLRWFTPTVEVDLCGHATLASAHVLWEEDQADGVDVLRFATRSGELRAARADDDIELDFPAAPAHDATPPPDLLEALGVDPVRTATNEIDWLVEVASEAEVRALRPDLRRLAAIDTRGVSVSAPADPGSGADIVSRFFAPATGIAEDPVTGSVHCMLGPWWAPRLGRDHLVARQASERGGQLRVCLDGDRVRLGGRAVTVVRGQLVV